MGKNQKKVEYGNHNGYSYKNNYENKSFLAKSGKFLLLMSFITFLTVFYISNTIALTELGYKVIELENHKAKLVEENKKLELTVETLSALDRIEEIAGNQLGMIRPKEVEFIAVLPSSLSKLAENVEVSDHEYEKQGFLQARADLKKIND